MLEKFERIKLGHFPTPIEHLKNITKYLGGPNIFIKRDDCTGLATGGNKTRKLEFLIPDAIKNKAELVVTIGAVQSNHARQTAAACAIMGLKCLIILEQRVKDPPEVYMNSGNVFLDKLFGADVKICPKNENFLEYSEKIIEDLKSKGTNVYFIPGGGSNSIGALGYVECLNEIIKENNKYNFSHIVHATGSSGTQAGLLAGRKYFNCNIPVIGTNVGGIPELITSDETGILVPPENPAKLAQAINELLSDKEKSEKLATNGNIFVKNNMTWDVILPKYIQFYEDLLKV